MNDLTECPFCGNKMKPGNFQFCKNHDMMVTFNKGKPAFFSKDGYEIRCHYGMTELWCFNHPTQEDLADMREYGNYKYYHSDGWAYNNYHVNKCIIKIQKALDVTPETFDKCLETLRRLVVFS